MTRIRLVPSSIVALAATVLVLGPGRAADPEVKLDDGKRMVELLDKIEKRLAYQETQSNLVMEIVRKDLKDLRDEVNRLQRELAEVRRLPAGPTTSTSAYPSPTTPPGTSFSMTTPAATARVRLVNTYPSAMTATVNGQTHVLQPFETRDVVVPAGTATFQVHQVSQPPQFRSLAANETLTLTLFPV